VRQPMGLGRHGMILLRQVPERSGSIIMGPGYIPEYRYLLEQLSTHFRM